VAGQIFCKFRGSDKEVVLKHDDLVLFLEIPSTTEFSRISSRTGLDKQVLFDFLLDETLIDTYYNDHDVDSAVNRFVRGFPDYGQAKSAAKDARMALFERSPALSEIQTAVSRVLEDHEIVYLPTYRRVELALSEDTESRFLGRKKRPRFKSNATGLYTGDIQFGLSDISERLSELNNEIISRSNRGYREISESIIHELIRGFKVSEQSAIPNPDDLKLFFSRIQAGNRLMGPYYPISAPDFAKIYSGEGVPKESRKFLTYFLEKLGNIIEITKEIEQPIGQFVESCNRYLSSVEPSTHKNTEAERKRDVDDDAKELYVDKTDLSVSVNSKKFGTNITLDALSSGEKQMISLFAKMYLYPKKKIVLIDEPELSLSLDWQREILVDVLTAPSCAQIIAITHSPFVFDNPLEPFAKTLDLSFAEPPAML
jgi:predicted ATPase